MVPVTADVKELDITKVLFDKVKKKLKINLELN